MSQAKTVPLPNSNGKTFKIAKNLSELHNGTKSVFSIAPKVPAKGTLEIYENSIKFYHPDSTIPNTIPPEREENDIKNFSQKSRQRLFQKFNKIRYSDYGIPLFLSLTWHYDSPDNKKSIKLFLRNFLKRIFRELPKFHYIWKFEYQQRGTPHFHIILFPLDKKNIWNVEEVKKIVRKHWLQLKQCNCSACKQYSTHVVNCETIKKSLSYIAKEIAKVQDTYEAHDLGRIWGCSTNLKTTLIDEVNITLDEYEKYINKAIDLIDVKISKTDSKNKIQLKKLEASKTYLLGLKFIPNNSTVFINHKEINDLVIKNKFDKKNKVLSNKLILKKYNWR
jgi:hypothetical protein